MDISTEIAAPVEACFDAARDIDLHQRSVEHTGERAVAGIVTGKIGMGESVTWRANHFGVPWKMTSMITAFEPPTSFQDTMTRGPFKSFQHDHIFESLGEDRTLMRDVVRFESPGGPIGRLVDRWILGPYLERFLADRGHFLKLALESSGD
ncbi:MAG: SRPBCC family protein [Acidobacteriota bacterium]